MKKILFLLSITFIFTSCNSFDRSKIKKLDNVYANNNIMRCTIIKYDYKDGVLDSINGKTLKINEYGLRGNLKFQQDNELDQFQNNTFKGTTMTESDVYAISDSNFIHKIKYTYKDNTISDNYYNKEGELLKKIVHHNDASGNDTLYQIYSNDNKLLAQYTNHFDSIGATVLKYQDYSDPKSDYIRQRVNNDKYNQQFVQKNPTDSLTTIDNITFDKSGKRSEYMRVIQRADNNIFIHFKYSYLTEDGLIDKLKYFNEDGTPLYVHRYVYDRY